MEKRVPVVVVTGASSGIGLALSRELIAHTDYRLVLTTRRCSMGEFQQMGIAESNRCLLRPLDVTIAEERTALIEELDSCWHGVDILVNNAGISYRTVIEHMSEKDTLLQHKTNYVGPMELIRLVLPRMRERRLGRIINVSSVGGMMAMPTMGAYSASKFALEGASEALWYEMKPWNIHVTLIQPGFIRSQSFEKVFYSEAAERARVAPGPYAAYYEHMTCFVSKLMNRSLSSPESVARLIIWVMRRSNPPLRVPATPDATFFSFLRRILPRRFYHWLLYRSLPGIKEWESNAR